MKAHRKKQRLSSPDGASCSICLETVESAGKRSVASLKCSHVFHLDCIGSAFNAKGAMQCPNCRQVEEGQWLYSSGSLTQQDNFDRNDFARIQADLAYLQNERDEEGFNEMPRWSSRLYEHHVVPQGEEEVSLINSYPYLRTDERQHQEAQRYRTRGTYMPSIPGLDLRNTAPAREIIHRTAHSMEVERPLHHDVRPSHGSAVYVQSLQPMLPRSYERSNANTLPDFYASHMLERPGYRRQMDDDGYEERSMYRWPVGVRIHRGASDMGVAFNPPHMHVHREFGSQGWMSSSEQSIINRFEVTRYGHFGRRAGSHPSYVSSGLQGLASHSFGSEYDSHSSHFDGRGAFWMGRRIPQL